MTTRTKAAIAAAKALTDQARIDARMEANRYKAAPVENYQPLFKKLNKEYPPKNYKLED
jgi:hypothetical protein